MAGTLKETAQRERVELIAAHAAALEQAVAGKGERLDILRSATELLDHCRDTQSNFVAPTGLRSRPSPKVLEFV